MALVKISLTAMLLASLCACGVDAGEPEPLPSEAVRNPDSFSITRGEASYDGYRRLIQFPGKQETDCPVQDDRTGVLLAFGQSNAANNAEGQLRTAHPAKVLNYFDGRCYVARLPLFGASGSNGEYITLIGDKLIEKGIYDSVVIISSGIGESSITRWKKGGGLNEMPIDTLDSANKDFTTTDVIWHQGESDAAHGLSSRDYITMFDSLTESIEEIGVEAPYFISVGTMCGDPRIGYPNTISDAQNALIDNTKIFLGANTDELVSENDRYDGCHFGIRGQIVAADAFAKSIAKFHDNLCNAVKFVGAYRECRFIYRRSSYLWSSSANW